MYRHNLLDVRKASFPEELSGSINPIWLQKPMESLLKLVIVLCLVLFDHTETEWNACGVELANSGVDTSSGDPDLQDLLAFFCVQVSAQDIHSPNSCFELFQIFSVDLPLRCIAVVDRTGDDRQLDRLLRSIHGNLASAASGDINLCQ